MRSPLRRWLSTSLRRPTHRGLPGTNVNVGSGSGLAARRLLVGSLLGLVSATGACSNSDEVMLPAEYMSITYTIDTPPGSGSAGKRIILPISPGTCDRTLQQIKVLFSGSGAAAQFTLRGAATSPYQASLGASAVTKGTSQVDLSLPLSYDVMGNGQSPVNFTTSDTTQDLTCTISLNVADPYSNFSGELMCQSGSNAQVRKLSLFGTFKAAPCPMQ